MIDTIINLARLNNIKNIEGVFVPSIKNDYCKNYFIETGFRLQREVNGYREFSLIAQDFVVDELYTDLFEINL